MPRAALIGALLVIAACGASAPSTETIAAERAAVAAAETAQTQAASAPAPAASTASAAQSAAAAPRALTLTCPEMGEGPHGATYRADLLPPGPARILSARSVDGACNIEIGYPGAERAFVLAQNYSCEEEPPQVYSVRQIRDAGQLDDLSAADRADIERLEGIGVVGVETEFSWTVYVPDRACTVRDIALAD